MLPLPSPLHSVGLPTINYDAYCVSTGSCLLRSKLHSTVGNFQWLLVSSASSGVSSNEAICPANRCREEWLVAPYAVSIRNFYQG